MREVLLGNLTIDINETEKGQYLGPGGSVFFMAKTFENLGVPSVIISPYGADFPKSCLPQTLFIPEVPLFEKTLLFKNSYHAGKREQVVENYAQCLSFDWQESLKRLPSESNIVAIAPILNNIDAASINAVKDFFPESFFVLLPQGFYRQIDKKGNVEHQIWDEEEITVGLFDFISLSEEDLEKADEKGETWSKLGPLVAVTRAERGVSLFWEGQRQDYEAFFVPEIVDPTGAGDVFAAAFAYAYWKPRQIGEAVDFAQAAACLSLRYTSNRLEYTYRDIVEFASSQGRRISL